MGIYNLDLFFKPNSVAVIGASEKSGSIGGAIFRNLQRGGFPGSIYPVHPNYSRIGGVPVSASVRDIAAPIDLAIIATPISTVPALMDSLADAHIGAAVVISAGGRETGEKGREIEAQIKAKAISHQIRILGPNCLGLMVPGYHTNASFAADMPLGGKLAFVSQSGAICTAILDLAFKERIGFSHFVSLGSMADVDFGDMIDYLGYRSSVDSILLYVESLTHVRKFMSAARSVSHTKPIIVLKAGKSIAGAKAAASHTGALAGEDDVYDAAFKRAGIIRVGSIQDLFDCAELVAKQPLTQGTRLGIISNGGGPAVMAADAMALKDSEPEPLTEKTRESLDGLLPRFWNRNNPIDILGDATAKRYSDVIQTCVASKNFDGILVMFVPQAVVTAEAVADAMIEAQKKTKIPLIACWMGGRDVAPAIQRLNLSGIPTYDTPERAVRAFGFLVQYVRNLELLQEVPERFLRELEFDTKKLRKLVNEGMTDKEGFLTEVASKTILETYGINVSRTIVASHARDVSHRSSEIGFPVAMKIVSPDITHKTEVNGIRLDIRSEQEARRAFDEIMATVKTKRPDARIEGVAIQPYVINPDVELLLGAKRDPSFGPVLLFGLGGIYTEVIRDRSIGLPPLNRLLIKRLIQETRAYKLLQGYRGRPAADMALIEEMIVRLSQLLIDVPEIKEADLNPVVVKDGLPIAVDARISLSISPQPSPMHLVISPYPTQYEHRVVTKSGIQLFIRPIRPEDGFLFVELFSRMSAASLYYRFCRSIKVLTPQMLYRLTQIDYDRELALVAIADEAGENRIIGAARIINGVDGTKAEFSIMIADAWQGKGVGVKLLEDLIRSGRDRRLEKIWGYVLPENRNMLKLGKKVGFASRYDSDVGMTVLTIDLQIV